MLVDFLGFIRGPPQSVGARNDQATAIAPPFPAKKPRYTHRDMDARLNYSRYVLEIDVCPASSFARDTVFSVCGADGVPKRYFMHGSATLPEEAFRDRRDNNILEKMVDRSVEERCRTDLLRPERALPALETEVSRLGAIIRELDGLCKGDKSPRRPGDSAPLISRAVPHILENGDGGSRRTVAFLAVQYLEEGFRAFAFQVFSVARSYWT